MGNLKRKAAHNDLDMIQTLCPFTKEQQEAMSIDYQELSPLMFAKKYRGVLFRASGLKEDDFFNEIQMNFCDNPFCNHYGKNKNGSQI